MKALFFKSTFYFCVALVIVLPVYSTTADKCSVARKVFEQIVINKAVGDSETAMEALDVLRSLAEGRPADVKESQEARVGLAPVDLLSASFADMDCRADAFLYIGRLGTARAANYLGSIHQRRFNPQEAEILWPATQVALRMALLNLVNEPREKVAFLERALLESDDASSFSQVATWAVNELCNRGESESLPAVAKSIRDRVSGERAEDEIVYCKERVDVIRSSGDRVTALASVLRTSGKAAAPRLIDWAMNQLGAMRSEPANAALATFIKSVNSLPRDSPIRKRLWPHVAVWQGTNGIPQPHQ